MNNKYIATIGGIILVILALWLSVTSNTVIHPLVMRLENISYDYQLRLNIAAHNHKPKAPIIIIDVDNKSVKEEGLWPWPRNKIAELLNKLNENNVNLIVFDMFFAAKAPDFASQFLEKIKKQNTFSESCISSIESYSAADNVDLLFAKSIANGNTLLGFALLPTALTSNALSPPLFRLPQDEIDQMNLFKAKGYLSNLEVIQNSAKATGFINIEPDKLDGIVRRAYLIMEYKGGIYPALSLQTMQNFFKETTDLITPKYGKLIKLEGIKLGNSIIPTDETGQVLIPFIGGTRTFTYYSATDILHDRIPENELIGKIAIIGSTATGLGDHHATAVSSLFNGVEIQATLMNGIFENNFSYQPAWTRAANLSFIVILGLIAAFLFPWLEARVLILSVFIMPLILIFFNNWIWETTGLILSFTIPIILGFVNSIFNIIWRYIFEIRRRIKLKAIFGQFVPDEHIEEMLKEKGNFALTGEDREMTVMFADIRNFTGIAEKVSAEEMVKILNSYLSPMTKIIFDNHGTIDKYQGDNIMAFWGAPKKEREHARKAMFTALAMQETLKNMRMTMKGNYWRDMRIGIGINSGMMSVGDMGSIYRRNYTVLGDAVNLASRVENLTKYYDVGIIVTESTRKGNEEFIFRKLDKVKVKGKTNIVELYELICLAKDVTTELKKEIAEYNDALDLYFEQKWDDALKKFESLHKNYSDMRLYKIYIERISNYKINAPHQPWDGAYEHLTK